ncbi:MAG: beta-ketoacyl synthase N-terminal-like domain-containing protein [Vulcanimicrobiota bacterium]
MDTPPQARLCDSISLAGLALCQDPVDCIPWLRSRKMLKFMGKQDRLAVAAACQAAAQADLDPGALEQAGLYLVSGHIPFEKDDMLPLAEHSTEQGVFSMERFSSDGLDQVNPLLTFRCLPNMPIFHVSLNLGIRGPSMTSFPGLGQFYQVLEQALWALQEGQIELAIVGAVADQNNFLVDYHRQRRSHPPGQDVAGFLCLRKGPGLARLHEFSIAYDGQVASPSPWGPAELIHQLSQQQWSHRAHTPDGLTVACRWQP